MGKSSLGAILHFIGVRLRVVGIGELRVTIDADGPETQVLVSGTMSLITNREMNLLGNVRSQAAQIEFKTTGIDETFRITTIRVFAKESSTGYPQ